MRVVQVSCHRDPLRRGGEELLEAWPTLPAVALAAAGAGAEVTVVQAAWRDEEVRRGGVRFRFVADRGPWPRRLLGAVSAARPEVIHLQGLSFPVQARLLAAFGAPVLVQDHADRPFRRRAALQRWGLGRVAGVAFTARAQAEPFHRARILPPGLPVFEVLEGSTRFTPGAGAAIDGDPCILWVGRLEPNKDPGTLLDAVARLGGRLPGARLWMCGEGSLAPAVRARLAADPALAGRVHLLGAVPHARVEALCRAADLFVSCSHQEGSGYALMEALACGAWPVATDIPSFRRITRDGSVGRLFPRADAATLARRLLEWTPADRARHRALAAAHFRAHLSFEALGRELVGAYSCIKDQGLRIKNGAVAPASAKPPNS